MTYFATTGHLNLKLFLLVIACKIFNEFMFVMLCEEKLPASLRKDAEGNSNVSDSQLPPPRNEGD
jgi:hypothetical protein